MTAGLGWEWVFFINVPVAIGVLLLTPRLLPESVDEDCVRFDLAGALTVTTAVLLLVGGISEAPDAGWTAPAPLPSSASRLRCSHCSRRMKATLPGPAGSAADLPLEI